MPVTLNGIDKVASVIGPCGRCRLHKTRRLIVYGRGEVPAHMLFIGEGPGISEDTSGVAFYGKSGKLLDVMLAHACELACVGARHLRKFITNTVLCHPTDSLAGPNRQPHPDEVLACMQNVRTIYDMVKPQITVFVGKVAMKHYGKMFSPCAAITHPASLLRSGGAAAPNYLTIVRNLSLMVQGVLK